MKVPLLVSYTSHEGLIYELMENYARETGGVAIKYPIEPKEFIPPLLKKKMNADFLDRICSEMEEIYSSQNLSEKKCMVSICILSHPFYYRNVL